MVCGQQRERPYSLHHLHCPHARTGSSTGLFSHEALPVALSGVSCAAVAHAPPRHPHHRHPPRLRCHRPDSRQQLPLAAVSRTRGRQHRQGSVARQGNSNNRLALPSACCSMGNDTTLAMDKAAVCEVKNS